LLLTFVKKINQAAADIGEPLIFIGGQALGMNIDDWPGMKPSECWMHEGISQVQGFIL